MKKMGFLGIFSLGLAIFTMFFGAGNTVFSLLLGRETGDKIPVAIIGFILTAVLVPILSILITVIYEGKYKDLLYSIGKIPGAILILICMMIIGPFGAIPRCVILSHAAVQWHFPGLSLLIYSIAVGLFIFVLAYKEGRVVDILGKVLGPLKIVLLLSIIAIGIFSAKEMSPSPDSYAKSFFAGFEMGYWTLDLLSGFFFAYLICGAIRQKEITTPKEMVRHGLYAGTVGGILLAVVYIGFAVVAAMYGKEVANIPKEKLLSAIAVGILGPNAGILANLTVAITCITTALALSTVFADYLHRDVFFRKVSYPASLAITMALTVTMSNLGFSGIMQVIEPVASIIYPSMIVLCIVGFLNKYFGFNYFKTAFFATLVITLLVQYLI